MIPSLWTAIALGIKEPTIVTTAMATWLKKTIAPTLEISNTNAATQLGVKSYQGMYAKKLMNALSVAACKMIATTIILLAMRKTVLGTIT